MSRRIALKRLQLNCPIKNNSSRSNDDAKKTFFKYIFEKIFHDLNGFMSTITSLWQQTIKY